MAKRVVKLKNRKSAASLRKKQSEFVANVSHELKTPLTIIKTHTETLLSGAVEDKELADALLRRIDSEADHMYNIVKDLLTLANLENSREDLIHKRLRLKPLIDSVAARIRDGAVYHGLDLNLQYNADPELVINADRTMLEEALLNICNNSLNI